MQWEGLAADNWLPPGVVDLLRALEHDFVPSLTPPFDSEGSRKVLGIKDKILRGSRNTQETHKAITTTYFNPTSFIFTANLLPAPYPTLPGFVQSFPVDELVADGGVNQLTRDALRFFETYGFLVQALTLTLILVHIHIHIHIHINAYMNMCAWCTHTPHINIHTHIHTHTRTCFHEGGIWCFNPG